LQVCPAAACIVTVCVNVLVLAVETSWLCVLVMSKLVVIPVVTSTTSGIPMVALIVRETPMLAVSAPDRC